LAIWKFSCNSFFKVSSNSSTYLSFPFVKLRKDKKNIQLLKAALNEIHSLLMDRKDYPIGDTKNGIQRFGKKTLTCAIFTRQYS
jgi:hypothetical protein